MKKEFKERIEGFLVSYSFETIDDNMLKKLKDDLNKEIGSFTTIKRMIKISSEDDKVFIKLWIPNIEYYFVLTKNNKEVK